jgi:hypothetical protein
MTLFSDGTWRREIEKNPKPGERIIFERGENHKGVCANPWAYVASPEEACNICITPPKLKYRVMRETIFASREGLFVSPEPEWEGDDLKELARKHPRTGTSMDDFRLYKTPGFSTKGIFQVEDTADEWIEIPDPRPLLQTRVHELAAA